MNGHETGRKSIYHNGHAARSSLAPQSTARAVIFLIWPTSLLLNLCPAYIVARTEFLDETRDSRANCYINSPPTPAASYTPRRNWKLVVVVEFIKTRRMEQCVYLLDLKKKKKEWKEYFVYNRILAARTIDIYMVKRAGQEPPGCRLSSTMDRFSWQLVKTCAKLS